MHCDFYKGSSPSILKGMDRLQLFSHALGLLYDAAYSPEGFYPFLGAFKEITHSITATLTIHDVKNREVMGGYFHSMSQDIASWYLEDFSDKDPLTELAIASPLPCFFASNLDVENIDEVLSETGMDKWLDACNGAYGASALLQKNNDFFSFITLMRAKDAPAFSREDIDFYNLFIPHIQRAVMLQNRVRQLNMQQQPLTAVLNRASAPVLIFDKHLEVLHANVVAREYLQQQGICYLHQDRICFKDAKLEHLFSDALSGVLKSCSKPELPGQDVFYLPINKANGKRIAISLSAIRGSEQWMGKNLYEAGAMAILHVAQPLGENASSALQNFFDLSPAEARLCIALCQGLTPEEIAIEFNKSLPTIRSQLRAAFQKTGTRRQTELVAQIFQYLTLY